MAERPTSSLVKRAAGVAQPVAKKVEGTVKTVAKEARRSGGLGTKVASGAARSLGAAGAKSVVTGGINALKEAGGQVLGKNSGSGKGGAGNKVKVTNIIEEIDIGAPRRFVYDQWTRFQEFPDFMKKVEGAEQVADEKLRWKAKIFWSTRTWESTIVEQAPDERIVWRSTGDKGYVNGAVTFHELSSDLTRVLLVLEYHPKGLMEKTGNLWRAQGRRARLELKHFRRHVMAEALLRSGDDTEGWRGEIHDSKVATSDSATSDSDKGDGRTGGKSRRTSRSSSSAKSAKSEESSDAGKSSGTRRSSTARKSSTSSRSRSNGTSSSGTRRTTAERSSGSQKSGSEEKSGAQEK